MLDIDLPEGLIGLNILGIAAEAGDLADDENTRDLAELVIRATGVMVRYAAGRPDWSADTIPYEVRVVAISFARRVFNNPQNQQRIQTGPLGESYSPHELTGLELKSSEDALLATFAEVKEGDLGGLGLIEVVRSDPLGIYADNRDLAMGRKFPAREDMLISLPSLSKYLGTNYE